MHYLNVSHSLEGSKDQHKGQAKEDHIDKLAINPHFASWVPVNTATVLNVEFPR